MEYIEECVKGCIELERDFENYCVKVVLLMKSFDKLFGWKILDNHKLLVFFISQLVLCMVGSLCKELGGALFDHGRWI